MPRLRDEIARWVFAALAVAVIHSVLAASVLLWKKTESVAEPAAAPVMVELAALPVAPETKDIDIAPGPEMTQAAPAPRTERVPEPPQIENVPETPTPEPDVVLPKAEPKPQPTPEKEVKRVEAEPIKSDDRNPPAPRTTAPPRIKAKPAPRIAAPRIGLSTSHASNATWRSMLVAHLNRHKRYPEEARSRGITGTATLRFSIDRSGRVLGYSIARSSGSAALDREVISMIQRANPLPAPPSDVGGSRFSFGVPVRFNIR